MVSFDGGSASKVDDVTALPSRHKMADMCYYVLHLQQYSHRLNFFLFLMCLFYQHRVHQTEPLCLLTEDKKKVWKIKQVLLMLIIIQDIALLS